MVKEIWNAVNNSQKVNINILMNKNVRVEDDKLHNKGKCVSLIFLTGGSSTQLFVISSLLQTSLLYWLFCFCHWDTLIE